LLDTTDQNQNYRYHGWQWEQEDLQVEEIRTLGAGKNGSRAMRHSWRKQDCKQSQAGKRTQRNDAKSFTSQWQA